MIFTYSIFFLFFYLLFTYSYINVDIYIYIMSVIHVFKIIFISKFALGGAKTKERQREISTKQRVTDVGRSRTTMARVGRFQRRRSLLSQHRLFNGSDQHQHQRRHQPPCVDMARCHFLQEAFGYWSRSGNDHWPCLHHSWRWYVVLLHVLFLVIIIIIIRGF